MPISSEATQGSPPERLATLQLQASPGRSRTISGPIPAVDVCLLAGLKEVVTAMQHRAKTSEPVAGGEGSGSVEHVRRLLMLVDSLNEKLGKEIAKAESELANVTGERTIGVIRTGSTGSTGGTGSTGSNGSDGSDDSTDSNGSNGSNGSDGSDDSTDGTGSTGSTRVTGGAGSTGSSSVTGSTGSAAGAASTTSSIGTSSKAGTSCAIETASTAGTRSPTNSTDPTDPTNSTDPTHPQEANARCGFVE